MARTQRTSRRTKHLVATIEDFLEQFAPLDLAGDWDNVGLLLGERTREVRRVMTCLTVTPEVVDEAVANKAQLIVTHHPVLFRGTKRLTDATPDGRLLLPLLQAGIAVYSPHTAFDNTVGGINDILADVVGLKNVSPLRRRMRSQYKLVVFVPEKELHTVSEALFAEGAGAIGDYRECSYRVSGTGTFHGLEESSPTVGEKGQREELTEWRLEVVCPAENLNQVLTALHKVHSYEEPAYDVYPLNPQPSDSGEGRVGTLEKPMKLEELAKFYKKKLKASVMNVVGETTKKVTRLAIVCGAGGEFWKDAYRTRADAFLTGEMRFHDSLAAQERGLGVLLPGHFATERIGIEKLAELLHAEWPDLEVWASKKETDPLRNA